MRRLNKTTGSEFLKAKDRLYNSEVLVGIPFHEIRQTGRHRLTDRDSQMQRQTENDTGTHTDLCLVFRSKE